jgi:beta-galactosidase
MLARDTGSLRVALNRAWMFAEDSSPDPEALKRSAKGWTPIHLPHTWNAFDAVDLVPGYKRGAGWYRTLVSIPASRSKMRVLLAFEGVNMKADVFVNGKRAGGHVGGYVGFEVDITPFCTFGKENEILVRADNSMDEDLIPSQKSDFVLFGGITRDVWLKYVPAVSIGRILIRTPHVDSTRAETEAEVHLVNTAGKPVAAEIVAVIKGTNGSAVSTARRHMDLPVGESVHRLALSVLANPDLWSPDTPHLYSLELQLAQGGQVLDQATERFGYRWFEFKERGPFFLNGRRLLLRGTQRHEDHAGFGGAVPDSVTRHDFLRMKEMGANFVRLGHYPQDPEVYRLCDQLGLLVWDELPWCRGGVGGERWKTLARKMLGEMIHQNFNHPSIILWSIGNEVESDPETPSQGNVDSIRAFLKELNGIAHELDLGRLTSMRRFPEGADIPDVFSPSIWMGWYHQVYANYEKALEESRSQFPRLFHMEYGGDSHVGRHSENPVDGNGYTTPDGWDSLFVRRPIGKISDAGDWSESYIVDLFDWHLCVSERLPWFAGNAQWIFKDFATPLRPENPIPYVNQKGLLDRAGNPKDAYYVFKSRWTTSPRFCYIQSHTWTERAGPKGLPRQVRVYSNCDTVRLTVNGTSQGTRVRMPDRFPAGGLTWDVTFAEGENRVIAAGSDGSGELVGDTLVLRYSYKRHGTPNTLHLSKEPLPDGTIMVTVRALDKQGRLCLSSREPVYFASEGPGHLRGNLGTPTGSQVIELASGIARIVFEPAKSGTSIIEARTQNIKGAYLLLTSDEK